MARPYLLTLEYPPQHGGVAKYLEGEVKNFAGGADVVRAQDLMWRFWPKWLPLLWRVCALSFTKERVGVRLWISHVLPIGYVALVWKWVYKTPYRVYLHGLDLVRPRQSKWKTFWVKIILQNADEIVVNSQATAELLKYYGIDSKRARVQYPRIEKIDIEQYKSISEKLRERYGVADRPILLTISRLVKRKGIDLVIKSLPAVWQQIPDLVYVVVGEGEDRERLNVIAREQSDRGNPDNARGDGQIASPLAHNDRILFTGSVSEEIKYGWLAACNCFILTPIDDPHDFEGYGIVYKEAQMFKKPVIGSRVGGVPEAIGNDGMLIASNGVNAISGAIINAFRK